MMSRQLLLCCLVFVSCELYAQSGVYSPSPVVADMIQEILVDSNDWNPNAPALTFFAHQPAKDSTTFSLKTNLEQELEQPIHKNYWFNPIYGLLMIEKIDSVLKRQGIRTKVQAYQDSLLRVYEQTYHTLAERQIYTLYSPDSSLQALALGYDLDFDTQFGERQLVFFLDRLPPNTPRSSLVLPSSAPSYLTLVRAQGAGLLQASQVKRQARQWLFYYALGGLLLGVVLSVVYHQFFWKKRA